MESDGAMIFDRGKFLICPPELSGNPNIRAIL
jgi:hypothetical protein